MEDNWMKVYETADPVDAELKRSELENLGIKAIVIDKSGKPYSMLGDIEIYVHIGQAEAAIDYIYRNQ